MTPRRTDSLRVSSLVLAAALLLAPASCGRGLPAPLDADRLLLGIGDRLTVATPAGWRLAAAEAERRGVPTDLFGIWLTRGWDDAWLPRDALDDLVQRGSVPVILHYFFGDAPTRRRVERERGLWHVSLRRLAERLPRGAPVLVALEPEWNDLAPAGEPPLYAWAGFGDELARAADAVRAIAPNALVGTCVGDYGSPDGLDPVLSRAAEHLDFIAFQELRAVTDPASARADYLSLGGAALARARALSRFGLPVLLAYLGISSHGGWEERQAAALDDLRRVLPGLQQAGVFGLLYFMLYDDPRHVGFFREAEVGFGLVDARGRPKPALEAFRRFSESVPPGR